MRLGLFFLFLIRGICLEVGFVDLPSIFFASRELKNYEKGLQALAKKKLDSKEREKLFRAFQSLSDGAMKDLARIKTELEKQKLLILQKKQNFTAGQGNPLNFFEELHQKWLNEEALARDKALLVFNTYQQAKERLLGPFFLTSQEWLRRSEEIQAMILQEVERQRIKWKLDLVLNRSQIKAWPYPDRVAQKVSTFFGANPQGPWVEHFFAGQSFSMPDWIQVYEGKNLDAEVMRGLGL